MLYPSSPILSTCYLCSRGDRGLKGSSLTRSPFRSVQYAPNTSLVFTCTECENASAYMSFYNACSNCAFASYTCTAGGPMIVLRHTPPHGYSSIYTMWSHRLFGTSMVKQVQLALAITLQWNATAHWPLYQPSSNTMRLVMQTRESAACGLYNTADLGGNCPLQRR